MGPTAIGKSSLALEIKKKFPLIELISVDSKLVYKGLNIGTDKPNKSDLKNFSYKLVNIVKPKNIYTVINFYNDVLKEIKNILKSGKIPLLVGGTMLYFKILLNGFANLPPSNSIIRKYIFKNICLKKKKNLFNLLKKIDPISSKKIHINDVQRVLRAVEVFFVSGGFPLSELIKFFHNKLPYKVFQFGLIPDNKEHLYKKIEKRFFFMLKSGFKKEVQNLYNQKFLDPKLPSMNSIGYKQMLLYLKNKYTYFQMIKETIKSTHKLVKHQLTWLKKWPNIIFIKDNKKDLLITKIYKILNRNL
ncbi:tRNA (adenosine(37)-N6)-dimethylallyltransferase MiaA [Buchnera aphidicola]